MGGEGMIWDRLTSPRLAELDRKTPVLLPIAATEQHGPHLPLATDRMIGEYLMQHLHEWLPDRVLILPSVAVGCSEHHMDFPGSLTLSHTTFIQQVIEILESVAAHGFNNLVISNSHGGNMASGQVAIEAFGRRHPERRVVMFSWWSLAAQQLLELSESGPGGIGHACEFETSLMLLIAPELVDTTAINKGGNIPTKTWAESDMLRRPRAVLYRTFQAMTSNGTYGDPTLATREKGELIVSIVLDVLIKIVESLRH